jgi:hypothetical protein
MSDAQNHVGHIETIATRIKLSPGSVLVFEKTEQRPLFLAMGYGVGRRDECCASAAAAMAIDGNPVQWGRLVCGRTTRKLAPRGAAGETDSWP